MQAPPSALERSLGVCCFVAVQILFRLDFSNFPSFKNSEFPVIFVHYRVRNFRGRVTNFDQSEARKQCFLASDWLKFETLPR